MGKDLTYPVISFVQGWCCLNYIRPGPSGIFADRSSILARSVLELKRDIPESTRLG